VRTGIEFWLPLEKAVAWCEKRTGKMLAPSQREALKTVLANRVVVITGGPGVGKTTLVNSILMILGAKGVKCLLCAPTGRAAKRLSETTGLEAKTIHRLLEIDPALVSSPATSQIRWLAAFWSSMRLLWLTCR